MEPLRHEMLPGLPRLGWVAIGDPSSRRITALHGRDVEVGPDFLVEGVWDGPYEQRAFAESENFFGSGFRLGTEGVTFVPSRALVDRLLVASVGGHWVVSNSLPLIAHALDARLVTGHSYNKETFTILEGIRGYEPRIRVDSEAVDRLEQRYYFPFHIDGTGLLVRESNEPQVFSTFAAYRDAVLGVLDRLVSNATDPARTRRLTLQTTISRGYDSPASAALISSFATPDAYTSPRSNSLVPRWVGRQATDDDGSEIASILGMEAKHLEPADPSDPRFFFAGGTGDPELIFASLAEKATTDTSPALFITGYHGGKVWGVDLDARYLTDELRRGDTSGLALTEVRLVAGWINVPIPFIGARAIESIVAIARSDEMAPWRVGGSYDRPIPRRIVEEAGVPRGAFGERKRAVVQTVVVPPGRESRADFARWLEESEGRSVLWHRVAAAASLTRWAVLRVVQKLGSLLGFKIREPTRWAWLPGGDPTSLLFRWAVTRLSGDQGPYPEDLRARVREILGESSDV